MHKYDVFSPFQVNQIMLRAPRRSDANDLYEICGNAELCKYSDWSAHQSVRESKLYIKYLQKKQRKRVLNGYTWFAEYLPNGKVIATVSLCNIDYSKRIFTVGYTFSETYQHKGLATAVLAELCRRLLNQFGAERVQAMIMPENTASIKLAERVGMKREGLLKRGAFCHDKCVDVYLYAITKDDFINI